MAVVELPQRRARRTGRCRARRGRARAGETTLASRNAKLRSGDGARRYGRLRRMSPESGAAGGLFMCRHGRIQCTATYNSAHVPPGAAGRDLPAPPRDATVAGFRLLRAGARRAFRRLGRRPRAAGARPRLPLRRADAGLRSRGTRSSASTSTARRSPRRRSSGSRRSGPTSTSRSVRGRELRRRRRRRAARAPAASRTGSSPRRGACCGRAASSSARCRTPTG